MSIRVAWVDCSPEQQRQMHSIAGMFTQSEAREELGLSPIRDYLSDILFPGSSTLHTRAKYALFVPWTYRLAIHRGAGAEGGRDLALEVRHLERQMIKYFPDESDNKGMIGAVARTEVKNLPSSLYWGMLTQHEILVQPHTRAGQTMLAELTSGEVTPPMMFARNLPTPPEDFPRSVPGGFSLNLTEAEWLKEKLLATSRNTLLEHFLRHRPDAEAPYAWTQDFHGHLGDPASTHLQIAEKFSRYMHGAQLLYNLMLSEAQQELFQRHQSDAEPASTPEEWIYELSLWAEQVSDVGKWDIDELFKLVASRRSDRTIPIPVREFVTQWRDAVLAVGPENVANKTNAARETVARRERLLKGRESRLSSPRALAQWRGASARNRMAFRWGTVQRILLDIWDGLDSGREMALDADSQ